MQQPNDNLLTQALYIKPTFCLTFTIFILSLYVGALVILAAISYFHPNWPTPAIMLTIGFFVVISAWHTYQRDLCFIQHPLYDSHLAITWDMETGKQVEYLILQNGQRAKLQLCSYAHPLIVIINAKMVDSNKAANLILWYKMLDKQTFRRLRIRVKHPFSYSEPPN